MFASMFRNRTDAGSHLAKKLLENRSGPDTIVLALVRGGVVVGKEIADGLHLPLHPYIVRKIGHPAHREFAIGAIAEGGATYLDPSIRIDPDKFQPVVDEERMELERRKKAYMIKLRPELEGKTVILTDDGAATGATLFAAIDDLRRKKVRSIILALPVAPPDTAKNLREASDEAVILFTPQLFGAVGEWYDEFDQVEDATVLEMLR